MEQHVIDWGVVLDDLIEGRVTRGVSISRQSADRVREIAGSELTDEMDLALEQMTRD